MGKSGWVQPWPSHEWATQEPQIKEYAPKILNCLSLPLKYKSLELYPTLGDPMDCSPPGFFVHGILQARTLEWLAMPSSRGSSWLRDQTAVSYVSGTGRKVLYTWEALFLLTFVNVAQVKILRHSIFLRYSKIIQVKCLVFYLAKLNKLSIFILVSIFVRVHIGDNMLG